MNAIFAEPGVFEAMSRRARERRAQAADRRRRLDARAIVAPLVAAAALAWAQAALADDGSPFMPPPAPKPNIVRLLAPPDYFDPQTLEEFERASGYQIAYDAYDEAAGVARKWREGPYDLVVLPGPALASEIALGALGRLDKKLIPNARAIQPPVAAKLDAYDRGGVYSVPLGWYATGLIFDADKAAKRLGGPPMSWAYVFAPDLARKMADCGIALPDARDALFIAAWRMTGIDPARATASAVKNAGAVISRALTMARAFPARDVAGALASGAACLAVGDAGEAHAAVARSRAGGALVDVRFSLPWEGGALSLDALAMPRDAPHPAQAYALLDFLLQSDVALRDARAAGLVSALDGGQNELLRRAWPEGASDPRLAAAVQSEWARLRAGQASRPAVEAPHRPASALGSRRKRQ